MLKKCVVLLALLAGTAMAADDVRQLARMPPAAEANLREEMRANLLALNEIISLTVTGKVKEAGELAEKELGVSAMGKNRALPLDARPGANMPPEMHALGWMATRRPARSPPSPPRVTAKKPWRRCPR